LVKKIILLLAFVALTVVTHTVYIAIDDTSNFITLPYEIEDTDDELVVESVPEDDAYESVISEPLIHTAGIALVAHAGGAVAGYEGSNSLEAMQSAGARNLRYIELDMILTSDDIVVLNHSWHTLGDRIPGVRSEIMTYTEFMEQRIFNQFTAVDLDMLIEFLRQNPEPRIITDTKDTNYAALYAIARFFPEYKYRFIPQVYAFGDAMRIRELGFEDIILTVYMMPAEHRDPAQIHNYAVENELYAVTIPDDLAEVFLEQQARADEMRYMVHTTNSVARAYELHRLGVYAVYTGFLTYSGDLTYITYIPLPVRDYLSRISANAQRFSRDRQHILRAAMFYKINVPAYAHMGAAEPIWAEYFVAAPFISPITGQVYFVDRHFADHDENREFSNYTLSIVGQSGQTYTISGEYYELFLYRGIIFISEAAVEDVFGFDVLRRGDYVVVIPRNNIYSEKELFEVAELLFTGIE